LQNFLTENNFHTLQNDPTNKDHKILQKILQQCNLVIDKKQIKFQTQKNPQQPTLKAQIKLHKPGNPIRPVINNVEAPPYKIAKHLTDVLHRHLHLSNQYNVKNSTTPAENLTNIEINENHKLITYDKGPIRQYSNTRDTQHNRIDAQQGEQRTNNKTDHHPAGRHPKTELR